MKIEFRSSLWLLILLFANALMSQDLTFADLSDLPEARSALTSASNDNNIFVVNGFGENEQYTKEIFQYNISLDLWSTLTDATVPKRYASAEVIGDFLYVFNGVTENGILNSSVERININNGSVELMSDNPQPARAGGVSKWEGKIYSFGGGIGQNEYSNKLYEFDPQNDSWIVLSDIPFAGETKGEVVDGKLYIIGGW